MKLVLAVSGGVDSVVMLHSFAASDGFADFSGVTENTSSEVIVAHFDHGLRQESAADARFVGGLAKKYSLSYEQESGELASNSEEAARNARWAFLKLVADGRGAVATAHHKDDALETLCINMLRGTNRWGLAPLRDQPGVVRPLRSKSKAEIYEYAALHRLEFVEDSSNASDRYLRNRLRRYIVPQLERLGSDQKLRAIMNDSLVRNQEIDTLLDSVVSTHILTKTDVSLTVDRSFLRSLPPDLLPEVCNYLCKQLAFPNISSAQYQKLQTFVQTKHTGKVFQLGSGFEVKIKRECVAFSYTN